VPESYQIKFKGKKIMKSYKKSANVIKKSVIIFFGDILSYLSNIEF
jgi:acid phosphatase class B